MSVLVPAQQRKLRKARLRANRSIYAHYDRHNGYKAWNANRPSFARQRGNELLLALTAILWTLLAVYAIFGTR